MPFRKKQQHRALFGTKQQRRNKGKWRWIFFLLLLTMVCVAIYHVNKPLPAGVNFTSPQRTATDVQFLADRTFTVDGERQTQQQIFDTVMKLGMNHPMGPLTLADLIGLDTCLAIMETLHDGFKDSKYRPCPLLRKYVEAGWLGRKTGKGFYEYK